MRLTPRRRRRHEAGPNERGARFDRAASLRGCAARVLTSPQRALLAPDDPFASSSAAAVKPAPPPLEEQDISTATVALPTPAQRLREQAQARLGAAQTALQAVRGSLSPPPVAAKSAGGAHDAPPALGGREVLHESEHTLRWMARRWRQRQSPQQNHCRMCNDTQGADGDRGDRAARRPGLNHTPSRSRRAQHGWLIAGDHRRASQRQPSLASRCPSPCGSRRPQTSWSVPRQRRPRRWLRPVARRLT